MAGRICHAPAQSSVPLPSDVDNRLIELNVYYDDLITGSILQPLKLTSLPRGAFQRYMKSQGKLGGQNKVPRLANDRKIADGLVRDRTNGVRDGNSSC